MAIINFYGDVALFRQYQERGIDPFSIELPIGDYHIGNFEFPVPRHKEKAFYDVPDEYCVDYGYAKNLNGRVFDAFSLANNHCLDYGPKGLGDTIELITHYGTKSFGVRGNDEDIDVLEFSIGNVSFCVIPFVKKGRWCQLPFGPNVYDRQKIIASIKKNKNKCDHVIIFPHWGTELVDIPSSDDIENARKFIRSGASAVIGHHPHIPQGIEKYKDGLIAYSLGSFIYIPEEELGYTEHPKERNISLCLSIEFCEKTIRNFETIKFVYDYDKKTPTMLTDNSCDKYFRYIDANITNKKLYKKSIRMNLLKRELFSFWERFRKNPYKTLVLYFKYLSVGHIKKILPF